MPSAARRRPPPDIDQFNTDDMPSEMLADDEEVTADELLDEELEDEDDEGIVGTYDLLLASIELFLSPNFAASLSYLHIQQPCDQTIICHVLNLTLPLFPSIT
jgi:hypothetical protein